MPEFPFIEMFFSLPNKTCNYDILHIKNDQHQEVTENSFYQYLLPAAYAINIRRLHNGTMDTLGQFSFAESQSHKHDKQRSWELL